MGEGIAHGVEDTDEYRTQRHVDVSHGRHLHETEHSMEGHVGKEVESIHQGLQSVRPDSFKGGVMGDSGGSGAEWWNIGNITEAFSQLPSTLQHAPNFFQSNPNTKPESRQGPGPQGVNGEGGVWGGV